MTRELVATRFRTPLGTAIATSDAGGALRQLHLLGPNSRAGDEPLARAGESIRFDEGAHDELRGQLEEYFAGERRTFDLALDPQGTPFQHSVWKALLEIPYGATTSYGQLAQQLGKPGASRAVGLANGANPIWLVVPCHRVIGSSGKLTGYAGGLDVKRRLLELEGALEGSEQGQLAFGGGDR